MYLPESFNEALAQSVKNNWNRNSMSDYGEITFQYKDVARIIEKLHIIFEKTDASWRMLDIDDNSGFASVSVFI